MVLKTMRRLARSRIALTRTLLNPVQLSKYSPRQSYSTSGDVSDPPHLWVKSPRPDFPPLAQNTVSEVIWQETAKYGKAPAIECAISGRKYNYEEVFRYARGFAASLIKMGVQRGSTVAFVLPNIPEFAMAALGCFDAGCTASPCNPMYTPEEIQRQVTTAEANTVVTIEMFLPAVLSVKNSCPQLKNVIVIGNAPEGCLSFFEMMKQDPAGFDFVKGSEIDVTKDTVLLPFSSGTTGLPKGVMISHSAILSNLMQYFAPDCSTIGKLSGPSGTQERLIGLLPFFHCFGLSAILFAGLYNGVHIMTLPKFTPDTFVPTLRRHPPKTVQLVPPLISFIVQSPQVTKEDLAPIECVVGGAAPVGSTLINKFLEKAEKHVLFQEGYGMTEMNLITHLIAPSTGNTKIGSVGTSMPSTWTKVVDLETGKTLDRGKEGEILVKGPQMMQGYFKNEKATNETITPDGWLRTGDIGYCDESGHLFIVDRLKELIKVKGLQVAPSELEDVLRQNPGVADVAVIGVPDEECGEVPRAYIVKKSDQLTHSDVQEYLQEKVAKHKQLKGGIEFIDAVPRAPSGKILRRELVADYKAKNKSK